MSGVFRTLGKISGIAATVATIAGNPVLATAFAANAALMNAAAGLTAKPPAARGSASSILISADGPMRCIIGRTYDGGQLIHDVGYGPTTNDVPNPYRAMVITYSIGPCEALEAVYADFQPISFSGNAATGYYAGFLYRDFRIGLATETALSGQWGAIPQWGSSYALSSRAAVLYSLKFDRDGKKFAAGVPQLGTVWQGVKCYDPRKDSTYPGGSGAHRWADPANRAAHDAAKATWEYTENPGLHALHYALGRWERDMTNAASNYVKTFGIGMAIDSIIVAQFVAFANVCQANGWKVGGTLFEPGDGIRWANLKDILAAGGGEPAFSGGRLGVVYDAPGVAIDTISPEDLAGDDSSVTAMATYRTRLNGIVPKYRSEDHKWEYVPSTKVSVTSFVDSDGEDRTETIQWNLVQDKNQVSQLATYDLWNRRELGDIVLVVKPRLRLYGPGTRLNVNIPEGALVNQLCEVRSRSIDPATLKVTLVLRSETAAKHAFALGQTGVAPPTPALIPPSERDELAAVLGNSIDFANVVGGTKPDNNATRDVFRGVHNTASTYERGDTVSNSGNTANFKAKQAVPAGIALTNSAYWDLLIISSGGAAGQNAFQAYLSNPVIVVATAADGSGGDFSAANGQMKLWEGSVDRTASCTFAKVGSASWATINSSGVYAVTDPGADQASVQFDVTYGVVVYRLTLNVTKSKGGAAGATGNKFVPVYRRAATAPATPSGNVPPSGWSIAIPAANGQPAWESVVETAPNGVTAVGSYTAPTLKEAVVQTPASMPPIGLARSGTSSALSFYLGVGEQRQIRAGVFTNALSAGGSQNVQIEWRVAGGSFASLGAAASDSGGAGDSLGAQALEPLVNSSGFGQTYEVRAVTSFSGGAATLKTSQSQLVA